MITGKDCFKTIFCCLLLLLFLLHVERDTSAQNPNQTAQVKRSARVLLIPLDDRPPCLQFPTLIGLIGDTEVVAAPREMLGRFTVPGDSEKIIDWIERQDLKAFDAAIVSVDMLAFGGLVNSRVHRTELSVALKRIEVLRRLKERAPQLPVYGFNVIMRLAPTGDGRNEAYREKLARWAELSPEAAKDQSLAAEVKQLENAIPPDALADYREARRRNLTVNQASVEMISRGIFDYLILSQDDAKPRGVHVAEREQLLGEVARRNVTAKVAVQPGADEVAMLLLARALSKKFNYTPRIHAVYSSEATRNRVMPFEDRPLHRTVSFHIAAAGGREVERAADADAVFYVYASRHENGVAAKFAVQIAEAEAAGRRVILADIDPRGDVQGADPVLTEALRKQNVFPQLTGYAAWNTAGNTIGTALPHGIVYLTAVERLANKSQPVAYRIGAAQTKFLIHRLLDDYVYHSLVRPAAKKLAVERNLNANNLTGQNQQVVEGFIRKAVNAYVSSLRDDFARRPIIIKLRLLESFAVVPRAVNSFELSLPWGRTFEAEIDFEVVAQPDEKFVVPPSGGRSLRHPRFRLKAGLRTSIIAPD